MAVTVESSSLGTFASGTSIVVTKPTGLAVGDLMIGQYTYRNPSADHTLPSGFTSIRSVQTNNSWQVVCYKVATSADVAASNFTFSTTGTYMQNAGLIRISGYSQATPIGQSGVEGNITSGSNPTFNNTVTPFADSMLIMLVAASASGATLTQPSGYAVATDNPTWTELWDSVNTSGGNPTELAVAYAVRSASAATGNSTVTASFTSGSAYGWSCVLLAVPLSKDIAVTDTLTLTETKTVNLGMVVNDTLTISEAIITDNERRWNTVDKSSTTWANIDKS